MKVQNRNYRFVNVRNLKPFFMDYWKTLLEAEDEVERLIAEAHLKEEKILEEKRKEATNEINILKTQYQQDIENKKTDALNQIEKLKESLSEEKEAKSKEAIENVRSRKTEIVDLLLKTVLTVNLE